MEYSVLGRDRHPLTPNEVSTAVQALLRLTEKLRKKRSLSSFVLPLVAAGALGLQRTAGLV